MFCGCDRDDDLSEEEEGGRRRVVLILTMMLLVCVRQVAAAVTEKERGDAERALHILKKTEWLCEYYDKARQTDMIQSSIIIIIIIIHHHISSSSSSMVTTTIHIITSTFRHCSSRGSVAEVLCLAWRGHIR
jgi:hypothetical protein